MSNTPTKEQQNVLDALRGYFEAKYGPQGYQEVFSLFLSAVAGSGKTTTIMMVADVVSEIEREYSVRLKWTILSFNKAIRIAINKKLADSGFPEVALTTNQLGRGILAEAASVGQCHAPKGRADNFKYDNIIAKYCKNNARKIPNVPYGNPAYENEKSLTGKIKKLVSAARLTYCDCSSEDQLIDIVEHYDTNISLESPYWSFIWQAVCPVIESGVTLYNATGEHDFDDQLFLPLRLDVAAPIYDLICVDEAQDLNRVRTELVKRSIKPNGCLFFVGDRRQAIQGFAFADTASVDNIIRDTQARELPLTCCWRCDANIIRMAQAINPAIQARPNAPTGTVEIVGDNYIEQLVSGYWSPDKSKCIDADMVICRVTADLVKDCLRAIRAGKHAQVRGRDIGRGIVGLLDKILASQPGAYDIRNLTDASRSYYTDMALALSGKKNAEEEIEKLSDQIDTLAALVDGYQIDTPQDEQSIDGLKKFTDSKFADESDEENQTEGRRPVIFSTIHKAKGLETDTVYILRGDLMPHPMASKSGKAWQVEQEYNCLYVAVTRPKNTLRFVTYLPSSLVPVYDEINPTEIMDEKAAIEEAQEIVSQIAQISTPEAENAAPVAETVAIEATNEKRPYGGRKPIAEQDKKLPLQFMIDPAIKNAFQDFMNSLKDSGDFAEIVPGAGKSLSEADVLTQALMSWEPFKAYFETSPQSQVYADRLARQEKARQDYANRKRSKKAAPAPAAPEDDGPDGGGAPAPNNGVVQELLGLLYNARISHAIQDKHNQKNLENTIKEQYGEDSAYRFVKWMESGRTPLEGVEEILDAFEASALPDYDENAAERDIGSNRQFLASLESSHQFEQGLYDEGLLDIYIDDQNAAAASLWQEEAPETPKIQRVAFTCLRPSCRHSWLTDYYIGQDGQKYRIDGGRTIYASSDFAACPKCGNDRRFIKKHFPKMTHSSSRKCDSRCWNARPGSDCHCQCGGANHGTQRAGGTTFIGQPLLVAAEKA